MSPETTQRDSKPGESVMFGDGFSFLLMVGALAWLIRQSKRQTDELEFLSRRVDEVRRLIVAERRGPRIVPAAADPAPAATAEEPPGPLRLDEAPAGPAPTPPPEPVATALGAIDLDAPAPADATWTPPPTPPAAPPPRRPAPPPYPAAPPRTPSRFEAAAWEALAKIGNWIMVGQEHRRPGTSVEFAVASTWLLRLGVLILVTGMGFFLKYSIDNGWVAPPLRVAMTVAAGAGMLAGGIRLLGGAYRPLGHALMGAGLAAFYFSVYAATAYHHLIGSTAGFALMALITAASCVLAVRFDSLLVAVLGICGGYGTPILFAGGSRDYVGLYAYLLVLGSGVLAVSAHRNWRLLNYLGFAATYTLFLATLAGYEPERLWQTFPFLVAIFALYQASMCAFSLVRKSPSTLLEWAGLTVNAAAFFAVGGFLATRSYGNVGAAFVALGLAVFHLAVAAGLLGAKVPDRGLLFGFLGLASTFLASAVPLALSPDWITVCWSAQALTTLWVAGKMRSGFLRNAAIILYGLVLYRFGFVDLPRSYGVAAPAGLDATAYLGLMLRRVVSLAFPIASLAAAARLLRASASAWDTSLDDGEAGYHPESTASRTLLIVGAAMAFLFLHLEIARTVGVLAPVARSTALTFLWASAALAILLKAVPGGGLPARRALGLAVLGAVAKLALFDLPGWGIGPDLMYAGPYRGIDALMRTLSFGGLVALLAYAVPRLRGGPAGKGAASAAAATAIGLAFLFLSLETNTVLARFVPTLRAGGISILWTLFALALVSAGLRRRAGALRKVGLLLFAIVGFKVFLVDLAALDPFYRIVAFLLMGVLILFGGFVYLRSESSFSRADEPGDEGALP